MLIVHRRRCSVQVVSADVMGQVKIGKEVAW